MLTAAQTNIITKLKSNVLFQIGFIVDNNPVEVIKRLTAMGYGKQFDGTVNDKVRAKQILLSWRKNREVAKLESILNTVAYLNDSDSSEAYTKGLRDYFKTNTPQDLAIIPENAQQGSPLAGSNGKFSFDGVMAALGTGLTTYTNFSSNDGPAEGGPTQEQLDALEAQKKATMWWWIGGIVAAIVVLVIVFTVRASNKKKEEKKD